MPRMVSRRDCIAGIGGIVAGASIIHVATDSAQAESIEVDNLSVANKQESVSGPVSGLQLSVSGSWQIESKQNPSKIVLRIYARTTESNDYQQITATDYRQDLRKTMSRDFSLNGNLLDLEGVTAADLTPNSVGESVTETISVRLDLEIYHENQLSMTHRLEDTAELQITKQLAETNATVNATGSMGVSES